jgi:hypothetical protein
MKKRELKTVKSSIFFMLAVGSSLSSRRFNEGLFCLSVFDSGPHTVGPVDTRSACVTTTRLVSRADPQPNTLPYRAPCAHRQHAPEFHIQTDISQRILPTRRRSVVTGLLIEVHLVNIWVYRGIVSSPHLATCASALLRRSSPRVVLLSPD